MGVLDVVSDEPKSCPLWQYGARSHPSEPQNFLGSLYHDAFVDGVDFSIRILVLDECAQ